MTRGKLVLAVAALALVTASGCGCRDTPLFSKFRSRGQSPDCPCPPYMNSNGMEGWGQGMPVSMPGNGGAPCPCTTMPGSAIPNGGFPGPMMPEIMQPFPNGNMPMPLPPATGNGTQPGPATPKAADPSDPTSAKKTNGIATSKPGAIQ